MTKARTGNAPASAHARQDGSPSPREGFAHPENNVEALEINDGMEIADFGSGSGAYTLAMAKKLSNTGKVYAIDIQKDLLRRTQNEAGKLGLKNVEILWGDVEAVHGSKIADSRLDLVIISNVLFQVDDKDAVLKEAKRILGPGGRIVIIDWEDSYNGLGPHPEDIVVRDRAYSFAKSAGFTFVKEFEAGAHHYGLIFRKSKQV